MRIGYRTLNLERDWPWIHNQVNILLTEDTGGLIAVDQNTGENVGACVMDNFTEQSVQCHFIITKPMLLRPKYCFTDVIADIIFNKMGLRAIYGLVPGNLTKAISVNKHMGFTEKCRMDKAWNSEHDYVLMELKKEDYVYTNPAAMAA